MRQQNNLDLPNLDTDESLVEAWAKPIVCRVEVDLPAWMTQLTGKKNWEVFSEDETDDCITYGMRLGRREAEVTLYHSGYAVVDVDGKALFDGTLTNGKTVHAHLSYFNLENGEPITFN